LFVLGLSFLFGFEGCVYDPWLACFLWLCLFRLLLYDLLQFLSNLSAYFTCRLRILLLRVGQLALLRLLVLIELQGCLQLSLLVSSSFSSFLLLGLLSNRVLSGFIRDRLDHFSFSLVFIVVLVVMVVGQRVTRQQAVFVTVFVLLNRFLHLQGRRDWQQC
jgi:hypothetical protein